MTRADAEAMAALAARELARMEDLEKQYGPDREDGSVLKFTVCLNHHGAHRHYFYAALRAGSHWYLTGSRSDQRLTWDQFREWLSDKGVLGQHVQVMAESGQYLALTSEPADSTHPYPDAEADLDQQRKYSPFAGTGIEDLPADPGPYSG